MPKKTPYKGEQKSFFATLHFSRLTPFVNNRVPFLLKDGGHEAVAAYALIAAHSLPDGGFIAPVPGVPLDDLLAQWAALPVERMSEIINILERHQLLVRVGDKGYYLPDVALTMGKPTTQDSYAHAAKTTIPALIEENRARAARRLADTTHNIQSAAELINNPILRGL